MLTRKSQNLALMELSAKVAEGSANDSLDTFRERVELLMSIYKVDRATLAKHLGVSRMTIGNIINGATKVRRTMELARFFGSTELADWIDNGGELPAGVLASLAPTVKIQTIAEEKLSKVGDYLKITKQIEYYDSAFSEIFRGLNPQSLALIGVKGEAMAPTFKQGDLLFVDTAVDYFDGDGVYLFTYGDYTHIKRLQKAGLKIRAVYEDGKSESWELEDLEQVTFHGKVKVHQSQKLNFIG